MKRYTTSRLGRVVAAGTVLLIAVVTSTVATQLASGVSGEAYGAYVRTATGEQTIARAVLPSASSSGAMDENEAASASVPGVLSTNLLTSVTTGAVGTDKATAQSVASAADISILNGLITAEQVLAVVSSGTGSASAFSVSHGTGFAGLVVNGSELGTAVAPNTRLALPSVGYVILNEQVPSGDGTRSSGLTVNMIHVVLQDALTGVTTGEIIVGSASSAASF